MPPRYPLRSQRSALAASVKDAPDTRSESSLTSVPPNHKTSTVEKSKDSHVDGPVLKPVRSYSDVVRTRADTPQPGAEDVSAGVLDTEDTPSSYRTSVAPSPSSAIKMLENPFASSSESSDESKVDAPWKTVERQHKNSKRARKRSNASSKGSTLKTTLGQKNRL
ncbi:hypothetical protein BDR05DRAFT_960381 [Suillus weaverae]|nr:hypothetical protein BDR05DRAFT_960381 [Suillus weaverae]